MSVDIITPPVYTKYINTSGPFQYPRRSSLEVSMPLDLKFELSYGFEIWQHFVPGCYKGVLVPKVKST